MGRIMGIDYGGKRVGVAVTDPLQLIASGLQTVPTSDVLNFLKNYFKDEEVELVVVGMPTDLNDEATDATPLVESFLKKLKKEFPNLSVVTQDERFSSKRAKEVILMSGANKKKRRDKSLVDKVSAALILQDYMESTIWKEV